MMLKEHKDAIVVKMTRKDEAVGKPLGLNTVKLLKVAS
jgi:hypothetical protein